MVGHEASSQSQWLQYPGLLSIDTTSAGCGPQSNGTSRSINEAASVDIMVIDSLGVLYDHVESCCGGEGIQSSHSGEVGEDSGLAG